MPNVRTPANLFSRKFTELDFKSIDARLAVYKYYDDFWLRQSLFDRRHKYRLKHQTPKHSEHLNLGSDLAAARFVTRQCRGKVLDSRGNWYSGSFQLPDKYDGTFKLKSIQCNGANLLYDGVPNFVGLEELEAIELGSNLLDDFACDQLSRQFRYSKTLRSIVLDHNKKVSIGGVEILLKIPSLRRISAVGTHAGAHPQVDLFTLGAEIERRCDVILHGDGRKFLNDELESTRITNLRQIRHYSTSARHRSPATTNESTAKKDNNSKTEAAISEVKKKSLSRRVLDELKHYYHGFRLLGIEIRISSRYLWRMLKGESLSRRERQQLNRSFIDVLRLVPFSVFIIVPFMEFLLPVALKLFPSMLPSTFQTAKDRETKIKNQLKVKIEMARFLQETMDDMARQVKGKSHSEAAEKFAKFFESVRAKGTGASNEDILKYSRLFQDEITLDSMTRQQLVACCKLLELQPIGSDTFLRYQLNTRLTALRADDLMIKEEGLHSLTVSELQQACRERGMRALGVPVERLQAQLAQWLELSLNEKIPPSLLLLSRALYVPENIPTSEQLKEVIQSLPKIAGTEVELNLSETEGVVDAKAKLEYIKQEEAEIKREELQEAAEILKNNYDEVVINKAEEIIERAAENNQLTIIEIVKTKSEKNDLTIEFLESVERDLDACELKRRDDIKR